mmetsp:Transcript_16210/g.33270  ORF Transcript_16210/g.33270 Transcript_16210/m.33270 type:complete len:512 (+) Transcript_16210:159-1694(+)
MTSLSETSSSTSLKRTRELFQTPVHHPLVKRYNPSSQGQYTGNDRGAVEAKVSYKVATGYKSVTGLDEEDEDGGQVKKVVDGVREKVKDGVKRNVMDGKSVGGGEKGEGRLLITGPSEVEYDGGKGGEQKEDGSGKVGNALVLLPGQKSTVKKSQTTTALAIDKRNKGVKIETPTWHAKWRISSVISGHLGWVRSIAVDPTNLFFVTGSADRTIKIWDLPLAATASDGALKLTLTGHINAIRGLVVSERHPYLFSVGEDKMVKCWDLEYNKVIRHYHGHLSGVFCCSLHPTLDVLMTGGRDSVCRVWDIRTKNQVHVLSGHDGTVGAIQTNSTDPQVITGSHDQTVKLWDLAAGKCMTTLTNHKKSIRAITKWSNEHTFLTGAADSLKKWQTKDGRFISNFRGHNAVINALACNDDGVVVSGADNGTMKFWDYKTGYCFQDTETVVQPGSLDAERGVYSLAYDVTGTRLISGEADKTIKIWKEVEGTDEESDPIDMKAWRKKVIKESRGRY